MATEHSKQRVEKELKADKNGFQMLCQRYLRSSLSAVANLDRSPGIRAGRPPSAASVLPGRVASLERGRAAAPSPHGTGTGSSTLVLF